MKGMWIIPLFSSLYILHISAAAISSRSSGNLVCAHHGWETTTESFLDFTYGSSYADCAGACKYHTQCMSFAYSYNSTGDKSFDCQLFNVPASGNFVVDDASPYLFYDLACEAARKMCSVKGYAKINAFTTFAGSSIADCAATCDSDNEYIGEECSSYAFGEGTCYYFDYLVADNVNLNSDSPYVFSDYLCDSSSSLTTTTTANSISKTATKTTTPTSTNTSTSRIISKPFSTTTRQTSSTSTSGSSTGFSTASLTTSSTTTRSILSTSTMTKSSSSTSSSSATTQASISSSVSTTTSKPSTISSSSTTSTAEICQAVTSTVTVYAMPPTTTSTISIVAASKI